MVSPLKWMCDYLPPINLWSAPIQPNISYNLYQRYSSKLTFKYGTADHQKMYKNRQLNY